MPRLISQDFNNSLYTGIEVGGLVYVIGVLMDDQKQLVSKKSAIPAVIAGVIFGAYQEYLNRQAPPTQSVGGVVMETPYMKPPAIDITKPHPVVSIKPYNPPKAGGITSVDAQKVPVYMTL